MDKSDKALSKASYGKSSIYNLWISISTDFVSLSFLAPQSQIWSSGGKDFTGPTAFPHTRHLPGCLHLGIVEGLEGR